MNQEQELKDYREYLEHLMEKGSSDIFTNGGQGHASILMSVLLDNTKSTIRMYSRGLCPGLTDEQVYKTSFMNFLNRETPYSLKLLVETPEHIEREVFAAIIKKQNDKTTNHIEYRIITEVDKKNIGNELSLKDCNFSVFDTTMFRVEMDPDNYKAFGSFNNEDMAKKLISLFDTAFNNAKPIN